MDRSRIKHGVFFEPSLPSLDLEAILARLNTVSTLQRYLRRQKAEVQKASITGSSRTSRIANTLGGCINYTLSTCIFLLNCPLLGRNSLKDVSATGEQVPKYASTGAGNIANLVHSEAHQIDVRLRQAYTAPQQYRAIYHTTTENTAASRTQYIR